MVNEKRSLKGRLGEDIAKKYLEKQGILVLTMVSAVQKWVSGYSLLIETIMPVRDLYLMPT
jgi:hypothetical protein